MICITCKECVDRVSYNKQCKKCKSRSNRKRKAKANWGLSLEEYDALIINTGNQCHICHTELVIGSSNNETRPCIDHDHVTGRIRGVLCCRCNLAIGYFKDSADRCYSAFQYLDKRK